jgi:trigger factor
MEIHLTEIEPCKVKVTYHAGPEQIQNKKTEVLNLFKKAPVPGFRAGKASLDAIKLHYRNQIDESLKRALAEEAYHNTLFEKDLKVHGSPMFNDLYLMDGKFACEFTLHTKPKFTLSEYKNLEVPKPHESESPVELCERMMQELRVRYGEATPYSDTDFVQMNDNVIVNYEGFLENQKIDNLSVEGEMLTIGRNQLENFDNNLLGMSLGETREFNIKVPDTGLPSVANKTVTFKVTLVTGSKTTPCPLDDSLAAKLGKSSIKELKEFVLASAQAQVSNKFQLQLTEAVSRKLVQENKIVVPNWMALSEAKYIAHGAKINWDSLPDQDKVKYLQVAADNVRLSLILDKIRESEPDAQLTEQEILDIIKRNLSNSKTNTPFEQLLQQMNQNGYLQVLMSRIKDEHVLDFVVKNAKIVE